MVCAKQSVSTQHTKWVENNCSCVFNGTKSIGELHQKLWCNFDSALMCWEHNIQILRESTIAETKDNFKPIFIGALPEALTKAI